MPSRGERIRTSDSSVPNRVRYQAALRPVPPRAVALRRAHAAGASYGGTGSSRQRDSSKAHRPHDALVDAYAHAVILLLTRNDRTIASQAFRLPTSRVKHDCNRAARNPVRADLPAEPLTSRSPPMEAPVADSISIDPAVAQHRRRRRTMPPELPAIRILIVDDDKAIC